jgi:hypothetical protein
MTGGPLIGVLIAAAFLGKAIYEVKMRRAYARFHSIERGENPWGYWIVVATSLLVGVFVLYISLRRLALV